MIIQNFCLSGYDREKQELFVHTNGTVENEAICLKQGESASFDTYFNSLSVCKWRKYTELESVSFKITVSGTGKITLYNYCTDRKSIDIISEFEFNNKDKREIAPAINLMLDRLDDFLYATVYAEGDVQIFDAEFFTDKEMPLDKKMAAAICTYRREESLKKNVEILTEAGLDVFVADNGHTLCSDDFKRDSLFLFENPNFGGSAGFSRCMIESAVYRDSYSHVLLMDDDAEVNRYTLERLKTFIGLLKEEYMAYTIGGSYFVSQKPTLNYETGVFFDGYNFISRKSGLNMTLWENVTANETEEKISYSGWFFCCIPTSQISKENLPLPLFIHGDDQDYGIRTNGKFITLNGICIWHPDQNRKPYISYYNKRNFLILLAKYSPAISALKMEKKIFKTVLSQAVSFKYDDAWYSLRGYEDFYKGIKAFLERNPEELNNEIICWKPQKLIDYNNNVEETSKQYLLYSYIIRLINMMLPSWKTRYYNAFDNSDNYNYAFSKSIFIVDQSTKKAVLLEKNIREFVNVIKAANKLCKKVKQVHTKIFKEWHENLPLLEKLDFWEDYLSLKKHGEIE